MAGQGRKEPQKDLDPTIKEAVDLLGNRFQSIPYIYLLNAKDPRMVNHEKAVAFRRYIGNEVDPNVYVNPASNIYQAAPKSPGTLRVLAGLLGHEFTHTNAKEEYEPSRIEDEILQGFLNDPNLSPEDTAMLMRRKKTVREYGLLDKPKLGVK